MANKIDLDKYYLPDSLKFDEVVNKSNKIIKHECVPSDHICMYFDGEYLILENYCVVCGKLIQKRRILTELCE